MVILIVMPFSTVLSGFSPYLSQHTFQDFLLASAVFTIVGVLLGMIVSSNMLFKKSGFLFFLLGMIVAPPFMIGAPETSPTLLSHVTEEHFRYGCLMIATIVFAAGFLFISKKIWSTLFYFNKLIIIPFAISVVLMLWDNYSSYHFSSELMTWIATGKKDEDFFPNYNFHNFYRTLGRSLLYIIVPWLSFLLLDKEYIKKWQAITLSAFCFIGIVFFFLCNFIGLQFYFPFMVPAVALAPAYWLGLALINYRRHPLK